MSSNTIPRYGYMCTIDFDHELGEAYGGTNIYADVEDLKLHHNCWDTCGITKVKIEAVEEVHPQNLIGDAE